jgi:glycosyltransferase involved in cell wall biosynthesis
VTNDRPLTCCYFGTYRENYSRNQMMIAGLRLNEVSVIECHETLWHGIEDRIQTVTGGWMKPSFWWRFLSTYWRLLRKINTIGDFDILIVGYPGQFDVFLAKVISWFKHKPLVWDIFMSIYLISVERGLEESNNFTIKLMHHIEGLAVKLPNLLILDTNEYVQWFTQNYGIVSERFRLVPTGADNRIFHPMRNDPTGSEEFQVLYAGTFIPNHGVLYIVEAAGYLKGEANIIIKLIGNGPDLEKAKRLVDQNQLTNVRFIEWMEKQELVKQYSQADICLGAFGTTPQSMMTVQNKIYETLAIGKPLISGDSPAIRQVCTHMENIYLCERANPKSIADAIITLWNKPSLRDKIAQNGYRLFNDQYNLKKNGNRYKTHLIEFFR